MTLDFSNRHVVVTGASGALGRAVVSRILDGGGIAHLPMIEAALPAGLPFAGDRRVHPTLAVDLADDEAVARFYGGLPALWASIHIAGGFAMGSVAELTRPALQSMLDMNLASALFCCRGAVAAIRRTGGGGRIVNVAAMPALEPRAGAGKIAYTASKAALAAATVAIAEEVAGEEIFVNAIAPSTMDTPANRAAMPGADFTRWAAVEDVAAVIAFLASPANRVARGGIVPVYGRG